MTSTNPHTPHPPHPPANTPIADVATPMINLVRIRRALISVSDKTGAVEFAKSLEACGIDIVSTGGTAKALKAAGIDVIGIEEITGLKEMMDGRVKTLHPAVHGGILARRDDESHIEALREHDFLPIDLVCINLYPFEQTVSRKNVTPHEAIEQIDIGGPALMRSAAKNHEFVAIVTDPSQYEKVASELKANDGATSLALRQELAEAAFERTSQYDSAITQWLKSGSTSKEDQFPGKLTIQLHHKQLLRYGENPHQQAALYVDRSTDGSSVVAAEVLSGKPLSYNNINDASAALELVRELHALEPGKVAVAVIKHTNPCGAAIAVSANEAFELAYEGDPLAAYGGILAVSKQLDNETVASICAEQKFFEVIIAPGFDESAKQALSQRWKNVRLLAVGKLNSAAGNNLSYKSITGGALVQSSDDAIANVNDWKHAAGPAPSEHLLEHAAFVWMIVKHIKSNAIAIGSGLHLLGIGAGQVDRVSACKLAIEKAGDRISADAQAIAASDAFFPFTDGPQLLIDAGIKCIVHPGGSKRDLETLDLCNKHNVTCLLTGIRHFRH